MSYDDECPVDWSTYDRVVLATANVRFVLFEMRAGANRENLRAARTSKYLDCIATNLEKMGTIAVAFAIAVMERSADPAVASILERVRVLMSKGNINDAWNIVETWARQRAIPEEDLP